jgi:hypothetical protein
MAHLVAFAVGLTICFSAYLAAGHSVSPEIEGLASFGWGFMLILWAEADARRRRRVPCFDFGFLIFVYSPLSVLWYCLWSRGWRGLLVAAALVLLWIVPYAVAGIVWLGLYGRG